jgi:hypothetical protein
LGSKRERPKQLTFFESIVFVRLPLFSAPSAKSCFFDHFPKYLCFAAQFALHWCFVTALSAKYKPRIAVWRATLIAVSVPSAKRACKNTQTAVL